MRRKASRPGLLLAPVIVLIAGGTAWAPAATAQNDRATSDPWGILDGTYRSPKTGQLPQPPQVQWQPEEPGRGEEPAALAGEWVALQETYRQSLERLGEDDRAGLLAVVADLEVAAVANQPERRMPRLARMELDVARELAKRDPEILVPIFQLHHDLYPEHRRSRQWYLLHHSVSMVRELAKLYVKEAGTTGARMNAARMLASLGGHLQAGQQPASLKLFEEVLELDPANESAYLGLAAHYEKRGGPCEHVVRYLKRLLEVYPEHREGRLRLAINQLRMGKEPEAAELFRELLDEPASDWVFRLAAQEMARLEARRERLPEAIRCLERAIERAPDDQKLHIQLAFLYDRNRQSASALDMAQRASSDEPAAEAPRGRYNTWPFEALEADRAELRRLAESRVQLLAELLGGETRKRSAAEPEIHP